MRTERGPRNRTIERLYKQRKTITRLMYLTGVIALALYGDNYFNNHSLMNSDLETKLTGNFGGASFFLAVRRQHLSSKIQDIQDARNHVPWYLRRRTYIPDLDDDWNPFW